MSTPKVIGWKDVRRMLDTCAVGWTFKDKKHRRWINWNGGTCTLVPLGEHGKRKRNNYDVETGKVRNLVWALGINAACATAALGIPIPPRP
jgi:hypothetical protein